MVFNPKLTLKTFSCSTAKLRTAQPVTVKVQFSDQVMRKGIQKGQNKYHNFKKLNY